MIKGKTPEKPSTTPRISVNKLAEYLEAIPTRRKQIVYDAKYPQKYIVTRYKDARDGMKSYISGTINEDGVLELISDIEDKKPDTDFQEQDNRLSIEALEALLNTDNVYLEGCAISSYDDGNELVNISGVAISINPDLVIRKEIDGVTHVGAMKLHISKTNSLSEESQKIVAVLLFQYVDEFIKEEDEAASSKICLSFDVFKQHIEFCPSAYKLRVRKIEAACEEIALWWESM
jgi:hypothetical protein